MTVVGRHPVHAGKRHGAVALDPEVNRESPENRFALGHSGVRRQEAGVRRQGSKRIRAEINVRQAF